MRKLFTAALAFIALPALAGYVTTQMLDTNQFLVSTGFPQTVSITVGNTNALSAGQNKLLTNSMQQGSAITTTQITLGGVMETNWPSGGGGASNVNFYPGNYTAWRLVGGSNVVDIVGAITNGGGGGNTNAVFYQGNNTAWRLAGGSNVVDVVGTLTNNTTGNAATANTAGNLTAIPTNNIVTNNETGVALGGTFTGNGLGLTVNASNIVGTLTNNTTGNSATATNASMTGTALATNDSRSLVLTNPANQFAGAFVGNGSGLTNLAVGSAANATSAQFSGMATNAPDGNISASLNQVTNLVQATSVNAIYKTYFTPTNYSTAAIQAALLAGQVYMYPGDYYVTNLWLTNGSYWEGYGATIHMTNRSGFLVTATNTSMVGIVGLTFSGDTFTNWSQNPSAFQIPFVGNAVYPNFQTACFSNRSGMLLNIGCPGSFHDLRFMGFEGYGMLCQNNSLALTNNLQFYNAETATIRIQSITTVSNYIGCWLVGWHFDRGANDYPDFNAEYFRCNWLNSSCNTFGLGAGAGNHNVTGCILSLNYCGVFISVANNEAHGVLDNNNINHCAWAVVGYRAGSGEMIANNLIAGGGNMLFYDCAQMQIINNRFTGSSTASVTFSVIQNVNYGGANFFTGNVYSGLWGAPGGFGLVLTNGDTADNAATNLTALYYRDNYSLDSTNTDGSFSLTNNFYSGTFTGNGSGLTNVTAKMLILSSNYVPAAVDGSVALWNSNNISQWSIKPGSTNFNFNY